VIAGPWYMAGRLFTSSVVLLKVGHRSDRRGVSPLATTAGLCFCKQTLLSQAEADCHDARFSTYERSLLSFQRPVPLCPDGVKKPPTRARGLRRVESYRIRDGPWKAPWSRNRTLKRRPKGRPGQYSGG